MNGNNMPQLAGTSVSSCSVLVDQENVAWTPAATEVSASMESIHDSLPKTASTQSPVPSTTCSKERLHSDILQQQDASESAFTVSTMGDAEVESGSPGSVSGNLSRQASHSHSSAGSACGNDLEQTDNQNSPTAVSEAQHDVLRYSSADTIAEQPSSYTSGAGEEGSTTVPVSYAYETSNALTTTPCMLSDDASITTDPVSDRSFSIVSSDEAEAPQQTESSSPRHEDMVTNPPTETCRNGRRLNAEAVAGSLLLDGGTAAMASATAVSGVAPEEEVLVQAKTWQGRTQGGIHENPVERNSVDKRFSAGSSISSVAEELEAHLASIASSMGGDEKEALGSHLQGVAADVAPDSSANIARATGTGPFEDVPHCLQQVQVQGECALSLCFPNAYSSVQLHPKT